MKLLPGHGAVICGLLMALAAGPAAAESAMDAARQQEILRRLEELRTMREDMVRSLREFDARIRDLEAQIGAETGNTAPTPDAAEPLVVPGGPLAAAPPTAVQPEPLPEGSIDLGSWGTYEPGQGLVAVRTDKGQVGFSLMTYVRYLNQRELDPTYTDSFGRVFDLNLRQDVQLNKVNATFKGWLFDPRFRYTVYTWTANTSQGLNAQVVVGGYLSYTFSDLLRVSGGIGSLPSTRTTNWTFPNWLKFDNRTIADEFFRGSYTTGFWVDGEPAEGLKYRAMIGNNLSQLGIDAGQLDGDFSTFSGTLWWMPTTGEYGPGEPFGDYEWHEEVATRFGAHFTRSREDAEEQPGVNSFENSQIRLSDGTRIFQPGAFDTDGQIRRATYRMVDLNAGFKYQGWSLEAEYYWRWVDGFQTVGFIPVDDLFDQGFQVQGSTLIIPEKLQLFVAGSKIYGEFGNPFDLTAGIIWYPFSRREVRWNTEFIYVDRSPVGALSLPYQVGAKGWIFKSDFIVAF